GIIRGIWYGIFHSISAFCNAGFDIIGDGKSMFSFRNDPIVLLTLAALIVIGGLGFIVWNDIIKKKSWKKLSVYSKIVLLSTAILILLGAVVYFIFEYKNPETMGNDTIMQRILSSLFQSVTTRTAGFDTLGQNSLTDLSKLWGIVLMMVGGASGSTAGGVKIGTVVLVLITLHAVLGARPDVVILNRSIKHRAILHAMSILVLWLIFVIAGSVFVSLADNQPVLNSMYEVASAYSTVGLSVGVSESASVFTKILMIIYMFFGRVGIMTISVIFISGAGNNNTGIKYPESDFFVG
ncbi:MAG: potassium transporter TrkG, partial [Hominilimicola sp.]